MILAMTEPEDKRDFRLGWSLFRRAHQAVAKRCHQASRAISRDSGGETAAGKSSPLPTEYATAVPTNGGARITNGQWSRLEPLLPENGHRGRQWRDHRKVLDSILWVLANGGSWRDLPKQEGFVPWQTAYYRYRRWYAEGLWPQILAVLALNDQKV